ncbi:MAG: HAD family hydrolase [Patescibacteria group bacterium]
MIDYKKTIKVIGFDLDQTLYPKSPEIDKAIQGYIYQKISERKKCSLAEAKKLFDGLYKQGKGLSGSQSLIVLGIPRARDIVQKALENTDIAFFLNPNPETNKLLKALKKRYKNIDLITGSNRKNTLNKLNHLKIPAAIFSLLITNLGNLSKSDGQAYKLWLSHYQFKPEQFLYIGDRISSDYLVPRELKINTILVNAKEKDDLVDCPQLPSLKEIKNLLL